MRVTRAAATRTCAICERSLLMGEHALRFSPSGGEYVDVCPLCAEIALEHGWLREGSPTLPTVPLDARRRKSRRSGLRGGTRHRAGGPRPAAPAPGAPPGAGAGGGRGPRPLQRERAPPYGLRRREEPRPAE